MSIVIVTDRSIERIADQRAHRERVLREGLKNKAKWLQNDAEQITDYCRDLIRGGHDVAEELEELETFARGLTLAVLLLKREASRG
jgi:hypothetical protein